MSRNSTLLLYGKNSILERLKVNPKSIRNILIQRQFEDAEIMDIVKSKRIPFKQVSDRELLKFRQSERVQGIAAEVDAFEYTSFKGLLAKVTDRQLSFIFLDGVTDPQNLGAVIRIAACFGGFAIILPEHKSCDINETVLNIAAGGENYVPVCKVSNLTYALAEAKKERYWIVGTVVEGGEDLNKVSLPFPVCLVLGSEGKGIHHGIQKQLELKVSLPMRGAVLSFNVAMASAIFCYEITKQKELKK